MSNYKQNSEVIGTLESKYIKDDENVKSKIVIRQIAGRKETFTWM